MREISSQAKDETKPKIKPDASYASLENKSQIMAKVLERYC